MANNNLTAKQEKFCQCVAEGMTYADAYKESYNAKKMKISTIYVKSSELIADGKITVRIEEIKEEIVKRNQVTIDQVLLEMKNWLLFDPLTLIDEDTEAVKRLRDMDKKTRMSISEIHVQETWGTEENPDGKKIKVKTGEIKKIKFVDKRSTADMFMKKFGAYITEKENGETNNLELIKEIVDKIKE